MLILFNLGQFVNERHRYDEGGYRVDLPKTMKQSAILFDGILLSLVA